LNITINIVAETPEEVLSALAKLVTVSSPATEKKTSRASKITETKPAPAMEEKSVQEAPVEKEATPESEPQVIPSVVELRAAAQQKGTTPEGKKAIKDLLNKYGSPSISAIPEDRRAKFLAALEAL
jgi:hypothetical protein